MNYNKFVKSASLLSLILFLAGSALKAQNGVFPGRLEAEKFNAKSTSIRVNANRTFVSNIQTQTFINYRIDVKRSGFYQLVFRLGTPGTADFIDILARGRQVGVARARFDFINDGTPSNKFRFVVANGIRLTKGVQFIRLNFVGRSDMNMRIDRIQANFQRPLNNARVATSARTTNVINIANTGVTRVQAESFSNKGATEGGEDNIAITGNGRFVANLTPQNFLTYQVNVPQAGRYRLAFRLKSGGTSDFIDVSTRGKQLTTLSLKNPLFDNIDPNVFRFESAEVNLTAGKQNLRLDFIGRNDLDITLDFIGVRLLAPVGTINISNTGVTRVQAESFSNKGTTEGGEDNIAITGNGRFVVNLTPQNFLTYQVNVPQAGRYRLAFRLKSGGSADYLDISARGKELTTLRLKDPIFDGIDPNKFRFESTEVNLTAGVQELRLDFVGRNDLNVTLDFIGVRPLSNARVTTTNIEALPYPNPAFGVVNLDGTAATDIVSVQSTSKLGKLIEVKTATTNKGISLDISTFKAGTYLIKLKNGKVLRFVKN